MAKNIFSRSELLLLLFSLVLLGKLVYDQTIFNFWTSSWVLGLLLFLVCMGYGCSNCITGLVDEDSAKSALAGFGILYVLVATVIYLSWSYHHIRYVLAPSAYFVFFVLV